MLFMVILIRWADLSAKEIEKQKKEAAKTTKKAAKDEIKLAADRERAYRTMYSDLRGMAWSNYDMQVNLIRNRRDEYVKHTKDVVTADAWMQQAIKDLWIETAKESNSFFDGVKAGFLEMQQEAMTFGQVEQVFRDFHIQRPDHVFRCFI